MQDQPHIHFLFVGAGAQRESLIKQAQEKKLTNITFVSQRPKEDMPRLWSLCDVALVHLQNLPLFETVLPSKIFEAMGMGLPIILSLPKGEASELLDKSGAGICILPENPQQLIAAIEQLQKDPALRQQLASNSAAASQEFSRARQAQRMIQILEGVVQKRSR